MYGENQMATSSRRKRFTECVVCRTTQIFPGLSENRDLGESGDFRHCPVCGQGFSTIDTAVNGPTSDHQRLEEFFARFS
jgi:hypothetical protein